MYSLLARQLDRFRLSSVKNAFVLLIRIDSILFRVYIKAFNNRRCVNNFQNYMYMYLRL